MKKRIGNDITFTWHIYRKSGETQVPESFDGKDVEVKLMSPLKQPVTIEDVTIATGVVTFTFRGKHQVTLGNYVAVLQENRGEDGMVTLDVVSAVTLVAHSYMEEDGDEGDVIEATSVELDSEIGQGIDAYTKAETDNLFLRKRVAQGGQYTERGLVTSMVNTIDGVDTFSTNVYAGGVIIGNNTNMLTLSPNEIVKSVAYGSPVSVVWADTLAEALAGKQDTINDLAAIRSGAQAGATAYQKPATGIPATDLASAVQVSLSKADTALQEHQSLAGLVNTGNYNTVSKKIELKHDNTVLAEIDATAFIKDGMVSSVTINNGYLVITFNTDAGKEPISIALTDIFNPANYYTKTQVDNALSNKLDNFGNNYGVYNGVLKISGLQDQDGDEYIRNGMHLPQGLEIYYYDYKTTITGEDIVVHSKGEPEDGSVSLRALAREVDGKENVMPITTATGATLTAMVGNYYRLDNVGTLTITLPTITGATKLQAITFLLACGSSALVTFVPQGSETILYQEDFALEADTTYEVTALWNGSEWTLSRVIYE